MQSIKIDVKEFENQDKAHEDSLASWELCSHIPDSSYFEDSISHPNISS